MICFNKFNCVIVFFEQFFIKMVSLKIFFIFYVFFENFGVEHITHNSTCSGYITL